MNVLGPCSSTHDSSAALIADDQLVGTPAHASLIRWCLEHLAPFALPRQLTALNALLERP